MHQFFPTRAGCSVRRGWILCDAFQSTWFGQRSSSRVTTVAAGGISRTSCSRVGNQTAVQMSSKGDATADLASLRQELRRRGIDALIVPSGDPHFSEFTSACFSRREFVSGFTGSAGTVVVTLDEALLWTDGRYFLQASQQLDKNWKLMRAGLKDTPLLRDYLASTLADGAKVGIDPYLHSLKDAEDTEKALQKSGKCLVTLDAPNPVDVVWSEGRPAPPQVSIWTHDLMYSGKCVTDKLEDIRLLLSSNSCDALLLTTLDQVCWTYNIRGGDVPHCPVALSYGLVTVKDGAYLYIDKSKVSEGVVATLNESGVQLLDYNKIVSDVRERSEKGMKFWIDPATTSVALAKAAGDSPLLKSNPVILAKARKNETELSGMREAHIKDGVALSRFLCWLENRVNGPEGDISEVDAACKLEEFRKAQEDFLCTSFETIAGAGPNGAIIHYRAEPESCRMVSKREVFLLDSGGQYRDGTTDVTRTMHLGGSASRHERECFTRVLQGHVALDTAIFPSGTSGFMLDSLARRPLWAIGLDYRHGTGHGVGACLNVHEGPHSISPRLSSNATALEVGMIVSNEPGYYEDGAFGIRIENLVAVVDKNTAHQFNDTRYLGFECLTYVPLDTSMLLPELLEEHEVRWLDAYHAQVWEKLSPRMQQGSAERDWLWRKTRPLKAAVPATAAAELKRS